MAKKAQAAKKTAAAQSGGNITDIPHEEIVDKKVAPAPAKVEEAEVIDEEKALQLTIDKEIKRFNIAEAGIAQLKETYGELSIADVNDKEGYKKVKEAWNQVRSTRTALEKKGLEIRGGYTKITKAVKTEEDRLIDLITPLEESLEKKWKDIDAEKERVKKEKEEAENKRLLDRLAVLTNKGMAVVDGYYSIGETIAVDVATIRTMTDDQFTTLTKAVDAKAAEIAQAKKEKEEREEQERQRLKDEQDKLDAQKKEQQDQQKKLDEQAAQLRQAQEQMAKMKRDMRLEKLGAIGMVENKGALTAGDRYGITVQEVIDMDDTQFDAFVVKSKDTIARHKKEDREQQEKLEREKKELEAKKLRVNEVMIIAGTQYNYATQHFHFANDFINVKKAMEELVTMTDADLQELAKNLAQQIEEAKGKQTAKSEQQEKELEKLRKAELGDAVNFGEYLEQVAAVEVPDLTTVEYQDKLGEFRDRLQSLIKQYRPAQEAAGA